MTPFSPHFTASAIGNDMGTTMIFIDLIGPVLYSVCLL